MNLLRQRGYAVAETDEPGWCVPIDSDWSHPDQEWIWDEARISSLLDEHEYTHLFVDGCRSNQGRFYDRFDHIVVLVAPLDVMLERVQTRVNNPFGSSAAEREQISQDQREFEPLLLHDADLVIDTSTAHPEAIADQLEALL